MTMLNIQASLHRYFRTLRCSPFQSNDNVACTDHPDSAQLEEALKTVGMKERVDAMPEGIHTLLYHDNGEGTDISGGKRRSLPLPEHGIKMLHSLFLMSRQLHWIH